MHNKASREEQNLDFTALLTRYISFLRALYLLHQNNHWVSKGDAFFAHHLLFERIYESAEENADAAAEKIVGLFGSEALDLTKQAEEMSALLKTFADENDIVLRSLKAENAFQAFGKELFDKLEEEDKLSLGMNDLMASIANERESAIYLLKQTVGNTVNNKQAQINKLANKFIRKLSQDQTPSETPMPMGNSTMPNGSTKAPGASQSGASSLNIDSVGDQVKGDLRTLLGLKQDLDFSTLKLVTDPSSGKQNIAWGLQVPSEVVKQYNDAVDKQKQTNPNFSVPRYIVSLFQKYAPGTNVLPAQPISLG